ncbi:bifunctional protein-serine/threonine kinase/phosphatase [Acinetobacter pittii]|uniref:bifunctional protein-serine/threonine kinase/phosphatase n=1 Tax=Acinetobacter TaxID=469 RepID=UPI00036A1EC9|nr:MULTISPECIES: bifunctional protein-serine/threonine kinase/phosphatase [Acinetobacter]AVZ04165.1 bifunctional protein-serine/threonine kinase/phosphatase [Acinetobacter pittii]MBN6508238.1 bifunctional protein-serine/threonine kinase/phosphatase [Acinetobacter pittii]MCH2012082.1 bifunctional protein-serine/threonine kinase/phosphatase [Acinetobacter pittii]MDA3446515.1 bifunctional protein-serine/threonine kinase/phosphatase [Acinetobacter sp. AOR40_HL]MDA3454458.1 bifunctional protein-ser
MKKTLKVSIGQYSTAGVKQQNQDFHGVYLPEGHVLKQKGIACVIADGIGSSNVSHIAAETAVSSFLSDYYSTSDAWSTQTSAERVIRATNSWLYAQTQQSQGRFDKDRGYVCTLSALILKQQQAHVFHVGDSRIYRIRDHEIELLTHDHRVWLSSKEHYLSRALGADYRIEIDYRNIELKEKDIFLLMTDGVYEFVTDQQLLDLTLIDADLNQLAKAFVEKALEQGSDDNLSLQVIHVEQLPEMNQFHIQQDYVFPQQLSKGEVFEGYVIDKILHQNHRSCLYLAHDTQQQPLVIKTLGVDLQQDKNAVEQFQLEDWVSKRLKHDNLMQCYPHNTEKKYLFQCYEYLQGETLAQWLHRQEKPLNLDEILPILQQTALALNAMHRLEMLHQDIRPKNIMVINAENAMKIKLIDYGSTAVRGLVEINPKNANRALGTLAFMAPEYFIDHSPSVHSDQFSLAVMAYYLFTKQLPYGTDLARCNSLKQMKKVQYHSIRKYRPDLPIWLDKILGQALSIEPIHRFEALSELIHNLMHPSKELLNSKPPAIIERDPLRFWQMSCAVLGLLFLLSIAWPFI